jgi:hypothetical protein
MSIADHAMDDLDLDLPTQEGRDENGEPEWLGAGIDYAEPRQQRWIHPDGGPTWLG